MYNKINSLRFDSGRDVPNRVRVILDKEAYAEKHAVLLADGCDPIEAAQIATRVGYSTVFAEACTALANGDDGPAKELCRREMKVHGKQWALELWAAIQEAVTESI